MATTTRVSSIDTDAWVEIAATAFAVTVELDLMRASVSEVLVRVDASLPLPTVVEGIRLSLSRPSVTLDALEVGEKVYARSADEQTSIKVVVTDTAMPTVTQNITSKFREAFEILSTDRWNIAAGAGDIVQVDGNTAAASYLVVSKSPWDAGNETVLESALTFMLPVELAFGAHRSQLSLGQEFSFELVDTSTPMADVPELAITSITQTASVLTVDTTLPHGLTPGKSIGIRGCSNQLINYPSLVVASIPSPTQFTVTAGPGGTILSQAVANPAGAKGFVYFRERMGRANNGVSQIIESASLTQTSMYVRSESGDALPSGTIVGAHGVTVGSSASVQLVNSVGSYAFAATTEYRINVQADRTQWYDSAVDSVSAVNSRALRTQVCPDPSETYKFRIRAVNNKALTVLTAKVISAVKTGTTTATFTTDRPHGLVTNDLITYYGNSNVGAAAFPNVAVATAVTVLTPTTFTMVIGTASTVTGYGGVISKVQGGNLISYGANANSGVSTTLTTLATGERRLELIGAIAWAGLSIGDYVDLSGVSNVSNGALLGVDGAWKVLNFITTSLLLVPATPAFAATLPANFGPTTSGGAVTRRTDLRVSFVRVFDYERQRVEILSRPTGDLSAAVGVQVQNPIAVSSLPALPAGTSVIGAINAGLMGSVADIASAAIVTSATLAAVAPVTGVSYAAAIFVTAVSGTLPTMDVRIEESADAGTTWFTVYDFPRITAVGSYYSPYLPLSGNRVRYVQTIGGTTPSFTRSLLRLQANNPVPATRQQIDRTVVPTTLNSVTPTLLTRDCGAVTQLVVNMGAITTTAPQLQLEGSDDNGVTWYAIGSPLTAVASTTVQLTVPAFNAGAIRARVSTAGVGATLGFVLIKVRG